MCLEIQQQLGSEVIPENETENNQFYLNIKKEDNTINQNTCVQLISQDNVC